MVDWMGLQEMTKVLFGDGAVRLNCLCYRISG